jgi:hypothetical protein
MGVQNHWFTCPGRRAVLIDPDRLLRLLLRPIDGVRIELRLLRLPVFVPSIGNVTELNPPLPLLLDKKSAVLDEGIDGQLSSDAGGGGRGREKTIPLGSRNCSKNLVIQIVKTKRSTPPTMEKKTIRNIVLTSLSLLFFGFRSIVHCLLVYFY